MRKLRICMLTTFYPPYHTGGCGIHVYQLSNLLAQQGHQVEIIHCLDSYSIKRKGKQKGKYEEHTNLRIHRIESGVGRIAPALTYLTGYPLVVGKKIKRILEKDFDVIHYHNISLFGGLAALDFGNATKLFTLHTYWLICPTHYLWKFNREICQDKECLKCTVLYGKVPPQLWRYSNLRDKMLKNVNTLIAPSAFLRDRHLEEDIKTPIEWISNFVLPPGGNNIAEEISTAGEIESLIPYFLFAGRLEFHKGVQVLIRAYTKKKRKSRLLIAGDGTYSPALKLQAGNNPNIVFLGQVSPEKLKVLYRNALALIMPSLWHENSSIAVLEAVSHALPIIATGNGGLREVIEGNKTGIVYTDADELVDALQRVEEDANLRDKLAASTLRAYQKHYTPEVYLQKYYGLIDRS